MKWNENCPTNWRFVPCYVRQGRWCWNSPFSTDSGGQKTFEISKKNDWNDCEHLSSKSWILKEHLLSKFMHRQSVKCAMFAKTNIEHEWVNYGKIRLSDKYINFSNAASLLTNFFMYSSKTHGILIPRSMDVSKL